MMRWRWRGLSAPCIDDVDFAYPDAAKAIIRTAILRWNDSGAAGRTQVSDSVGPFSHAESYQQPVRRALFSAPEIQQLQALCKSSQAGRAFEVDSTPPAPASASSMHTSTPCGTGATRPCGTAATRWDMSSFPWPSEQVIRHRGGGGDENGQIIADASRRR
jgi:hypothetical protein